MRAGPASRLHRVKGVYDPDSVRPRPSITQTGASSALSCFLLNVIDEKALASCTRRVLTPCCIRRKRYIPENGLCYIGPRIDGPPKLIAPGGNTRGQLQLYKMTTVFVTSGCSIAFSSRVTSIGTFGATNSGLQQHITRNYAY